MNTTTQSPPQWSRHRVQTEDDPKIGVNVHELDSGRPGPTLLVLGGVHGNEIGGIVAAGRIVSTALNLVSGRLVVVPVSHEAAYEADLRVSPLDGGNLARSFPGSAEGTPTEQLAWLLAEELISQADALIDLHTSTPFTDMPLFVGCLDDGTPAATRAVDLATSFGIPVVWTHPDLGAGRTLTMARDRGIPALYIESPRGGVLDPEYLEAYISGVQSVLERLGMVSECFTREPPRLWLHGNGDTDTFSTAPDSGLFLSSVTLMQEVERHDPVGEILNTAGTRVSEIVALTAGFVTTLQRAAILDEGQPIVGITPERPSTLGLPSDEFFSRVRNER